MKKIIFLLMTTEKYSERQDNIINSWGKGLDLYFYSEHSDDTRNVLKVCDENNVEIKQISVFKTLKEKFYNQSEWYFFGDDDTFVNVNLLLSELDNFDKNKVHGQDLGLYKCYGDLHYPSGGAGFLIHNSIVHNFFDSISFNVNISDVSFGYNMRDKNIEISHSEKFLSQHPSFYSIDSEDINKYLTFHYVKSVSEMQLFNEICEKSNK